MLMFCLSSILQKLPKAQYLRKPSLYGSYLTVLPKKPSLFLSEVLACGGIDGFMAYFECTVLQKPSELYAVLSQNSRIGREMTNHQWLPLRKVLLELVIPDLHQYQITSYVMRNKAIPLPCCLSYLGLSIQAQQ